MAAASAYRTVTTITIHSRLNLKKRQKKSMRITSTLPKKAKYVKIFG
jgi:hypothetical protein